MQSFNFLIKFSANSKTILMFLIPTHQIYSRLKDKILLLHICFPISFYCKMQYQEVEGVIFFLTSKLLTTFMHKNTEHNNQESRYHPGGSLNTPVLPQPEGFLNWKVAIFCRLLFLSDIQTVQF